MRRALFVVALLTMSTLAFAQQTQPTLAQQRVDSAERVLALLTAQYQNGTGTLDDLALWTARWFQAKRDTGVTGAPLVAAAQQWVDKTRVFEQLVQHRVQMGTASQADAEKAKFYRLEAEMTLAKLKTP